MENIERTLIFNKPMPDVPPVTFNEGDLLAQVLARAKEAELHPDSNFSVDLMENILRVIYPRLTPAIQGATFGHLAGQRVRVLVFKGCDVIRKMSAIVGDKANPSLCDPSSLRHQMWVKTREHHTNRRIGIEGVNVGQERYWFNFLHCTRTESEFQTQYELLMKYRCIGLEAA
jgi:hypothetical protein